MGDYLALVLIAAAIMLPRWSVRNVGKHELPDCYGSNPGPQQRAENDCIHCQWNDLCLRGPARFTKEELEDRDEA